MTPSLVCFDIGGVLVRITFDIDEAGGARPGGHLFTHHPCFLDYQRGALTTAEYLETFSQELKVSQQEAIRIHNGLAIEPYPGTLELIESLHGQGIATACLSNTNELHWRYMLDSGRFPNLEAVQHKLASFELRLEKPDSAFYRALESETHTSAEGIMFFDDGLVNVEAAKACGWRAHLVDPNGDPAVQMAHHLRAANLSLT